MTKKLFYTDENKDSMEAIVLSCEKENDFYKIILDQTVFFPQGGGQASDKGLLDGQVVHYVKEVEDKILHYVEKPIDIGKKVYGKIEWNFRFHQMQKHTAEHIIVGLLHKHYGFENIGFHMGDEYVQLDINGVISKEEIDEIEEKANQIVWENKPIGSFFPTEAEIEKLTYRGGDVIFGDIRLVEIEGADTCACCGLHVSYTGEVGMIKIIEAFNYKKGMRMIVKCAIDAYNDYKQKHNQIVQLSQLLSAKPFKVFEAVVELEEEITKERQEYNDLLNSWLDTKADNMEEGEFCILFEDMSPETMRFYTTRLIEKIDNVFVFSKVDDIYRYCLGSKKTNMRPLCLNLNKEFSGKGGGNEQMCQGYISGNKKEIESFIKSELI